MEHRSGEKDQKSERVQGKEREQAWQQMREGCGQEQGRHAGVCVYTTQAAGRKGGSRQSRGAHKT